MADKPRTKTELLEEVARLTRKVKRQERKLAPADQAGPKKSRAKKKGGESPLDFHSLYETMALGVVFQDAAGDIVEANPAAQKILGLSRDQLLGRTSLDPDWRATHEDGSEFAGESHPSMRAWRTGQPVHDVVMGVFNPRLNEQRWILVNAVPLKKPRAKKPFLVYTTFNDITELKRAQAELEESEDLYRTLYEGAAEGVLVADAETRRFIYANPAIQKMLGYESDQLLGLGVPDIHPQDELERTLSEFQALANKDKQIAADIVCLRRDGTTFIAEISGSSIMIGGRLSLVGFFTDVTERARAQEAVRRREERYRIAARMTGQLIYDYDVASGEISWAGMIEEITGFSAEEFAGIDIAAWEEMIHPQDRERALKLLNQAMEDCATYHVEYRFRQQDGTYMEIEDQGAFLPDGSGKAARMLGAMNDITARRRAEDELKESERKFRSIVEASPMGMHLYELTADDRLVFTGANPAADRLLGVDNSIFIGRTIEEAFPPLVETEVPLRYRRACSDGEPWRTEQIAYQDEQIQGAFEVHAFQTSPGKMAALFLDITERKLAEEALRNSEKWLATTLNSVGDAVITTDINGRVSFLNTVAVQLTGWTIEEARDRPLAEVFRIVSEQTREPAEDPVAKVLADKTVVALANHAALIARDGTEVPIADSGAPIMDHEGNILGVVLVFRDVSEQRAREAVLRQQQKLEAIGTLAGGVAHEINNPIGIIMNFAEIIIHDAAGQDQIQDHARTVFKEGERIAVIVRNLLQFSRHEKESYSPALISDIVGATLSLTNKVLAKDQITITTDVSPDLPKIKCRSQQLMQVLMNLITNARDALNARYQGHHDDKIIAITVRLRELEGKRWIRTTVEDRGVGIAPEIGPRIFDPFFTTKPRDQGTGLGLSISHGIVRDHGGELTFESEPGSFTRFHIDLPVDNGWKRTGPD